MNNIFRKLFILLLTLATFSVVASAQDAKKLYQQGKALYDAKNYTEAVPKLKAAADKGNKKALYRLGRCYEKGRGVQKDLNMAFGLYTKGAAQNHAKSQYALGRCYLRGKGVQADKAQAKQWFVKAFKNPNGGSELKSKVQKEAKGGDEKAKEILQLIK